MQIKRHWQISLMCGYEKPNHLIIYLALLRFVARVEFNNLVSPMLCDGKRGKRLQGEGKGARRNTARIMFFTVGPFPEQRGVSCPI